MSLSSLLLLYDGVLHLRLASGWKIVENLWKKCKLFLYIFSVSFLILVSTSRVQGFDSCLLVFCMFFHALGFSSEFSCFLLQSKDIPRSLIGISKLSRLSERVNICLLIGWHPVQCALCPESSGTGPRLPMTLYSMEIHMYTGIKEKLISNSFSNQMI